MLANNINPFVNIQISLRGEAVTFQYKIDPAFKGKGPYTFNLLAYQDESFTTVLYSIPSSTFYVTDDTKTRRNPLPSFFYKIQLVTADGQSYMSEFLGWHPSDSLTQHHYLLASEISRRERVRFNYAGLFAYVLKRQTYSTEPGIETDPITGEPMVDDSLTYGVGVAGGYYNPVLTRISIEAREIKEDFDEGGRGTQYSELLKVRSVGFPFLDAHDILVTPDGKRYTVTDISNKYFPGTTLILIQTPSVRLIPMTDTIYNIPVPAFPQNA